MNQKKEEVEQKKNEYNFKMRQLEYVMDSAAEYPQVLIRKSVLQEDWRFVGDKSLEITKTVASFLFLFFFP